MPGCNSFYYLFKRIDVLGSPFCFHVQGTNKKYKTAFGGMITVLMCILGLSYFLYMLVQWLDGRMIPRIQQVQQAFTTKQIIPLSISPISIGYLFQENFPPPDLGGRIPLSPRLMLRQNNEVKPVPKGIIECNFDDELLKIYNGQFCINIEEGSHSMIILVSQLVLNPSDRSDDIQLEIIVYQCHPDFLQSGQKCATINETADYINTPFAQFTQVLYNQDYNMTTQVVQTVPTIVYQYYDPQLFFQSQIDLVLCEALHNNGVFLDDISNYRFISQSQINTYTLTQDTIKKKLQIHPKYKLYFAFSLSISKNGIQISIAQIKLAEILAQISSIIQIIMILRFIGEFYSEYRLDKKIEQRLLKSYFPEYTQLIKYLKGLGRKNIDKKANYTFVRKLEKQLNAEPKRSRYMNGQATRGPTYYLGCLTKPFRTNNMSTTPQGPEVELTEGNKKAHVPLVASEIEETQQRIIKPEHIKRMKKAILHKVDLKYFLKETFSMQKGVSFLLGKDMYEMLSMMGCQISAEPRKDELLYRKFTTHISLRGERQFDPPKVEHQFPYISNHKYKRIERLQQHSQNSDLLKDYLAKLQQTLLLRIQQSDPQQESAPSNEP